MADYLTDKRIDKLEAQVKRLQKQIADLTRRLETSEARD